MPRKAKEKEPVISIKETPKIENQIKNNISITSKIEPSKKASKSNSSAVKQKKIKKTSSNTSSSKIESTTKKAISKTTSTKEVKSRSKSTKSPTTAKKNQSNSRKKNTINVLEYYDLPYRYNETTVKLLAQTPTSLFVYWDISDNDIKDLTTKYGEDFFTKTKPFLLINNETMNYTFEVEINDFANCWYLNINDPKCIYSIKLVRKYIKQNQSYENNDIFYIASSNLMDAPNNRILFNLINNTVYFKNVKTNEIEEKNISSNNSINNIGKIYNIYDLYKQIYSEENINNFDVNAPSSSFRI